MTEAQPVAQLCADAHATAVAVAQAGGITVREIREPAEHRAIERLLSHIWQTGHKPPPMSGDIMRMLSYTGSYVAGAYIGTRLIGAAVGFLTNGLPEIGAAHLHSHVVGVAPEERGRQVGYALKMHQRAWALEHGFNRITWTFDPLVRRNAHFNLNKLQAQATQYLVDFYGEMHDGLNSAQGSDRLLVEWLLEAPEVLAAVRGLPMEPDVRFREAATRSVLKCGSGGAPELAHPPGHGVSACEIPADIEAMRQSDPELGRWWRRAVRSVLCTAMSGGTRIAAFDRQLGYLLVDDSGRSQ